MNPRRTLRVEVPVLSFLLLTLAACTPGLTPPSPPGLLGMVQASPTEVRGSDEKPASPTTTPPATTTSTPAPTPTDEPGCPEPVEGTQLLRRDELGYCLLYSDGYLEIDTGPAQVCLVPEGPTLACHNASAFINVEAASGRTAAQVADGIVTDAEARIPGIVIGLRGVMVSGVGAIELEGLPGVAASRNTYIVHADRLYTLVFIGPWGEAGHPELERSEQFYDTVLNSFTFLPAADLFPGTPAATPPRPGRRTETGSRSHPRVPCLSHSRLLKRQRV